MNLKLLAAVAALGLLVGCRAEDDVPAQGEPPVASAGTDSTGPSPAIVEASVNANAIAVAQFQRLIHACKAKTTGLQEARDAKSVLDAGIKDWEAVPGTDEEKGVNGACASMLYDAQALAGGCLEDGPKWGDFEQQQAKHYVEDAQACAAMLAPK